MTAKASPVDGAVLTPAQLAQASGVRVTTIQRWQKRYDFPQGVRRPGGHRRYRPQDIDLVRRVVALRDAGTPMREAIQTAGASTPAQSTGIEELRSQAADALRELDEPRLWRLFDEAVAGHSAGAVVHDLIIPLIRTTDDPSDARQPERIQAYFFSRIAAVVLSRIASGATQPPGRPVWVACPQGEAHEIGALCAVVLLTGRGVNARYVGTNVDLETLERAAGRHRPRAVVLSVTRSLVAREQLTGIKHLGRTVPVFVAGHETWRTETADGGIRTLLGDLEESLDELQAWLGQQGADPEPASREGER